MFPYRPAAFMFRLLLALSCGAGLVLQSGILEGKFIPVQLIFFTIQSNLIIFIAFAVLTVRTATDIRSQGVRGHTVFPAWLAGMLTLAIATTGLVYAFVLVPNLPNDTTYAVGSVADVLIHVSTPLAVFIDFLLFNPHKRMRWTMPVAWLAVPLSYLIFALVRAQFGPFLVEGNPMWYPYFFIDLHTLSAGQVAVNCAFFSIGYLAMGLLLVFLDRILPALIETGADPQEVGGVPRQYVSGD